jgi:undecaprenyl-diphosphatase
MIEYIIIAILQGLFEWLPISSSGQVMIVAVNFFGIPPEEAYSLSIWLHLGTMFAVLLKFKKDYIRIVKSFLPMKFNIIETDIKKRNWLIVGTIGTAITALPLYFIFKFIIVGEFTAVHGDLLTLIIAGMLIITGIILLLIKKKFGVKTIESVEKQNVIKDSFIIGLIQGVAVLPGISRSAITVSTTLIENYEQDSALRLSFLMSVPVVIASIAVDIIFGEGSVFRILDPITIIIITFFVYRNPVKNS